MHTETITYAMCNDRGEAVMKFGDFASLQNWIRSQTEKHGKVSGTPCRITTITKTENIDDAES